MQFHIAITYSNFFFLFARIFTMKTSTESILEALLETSYCKKYI